MNRTASFLLLIASALFVSQIASAKLTEQQANNLYANAQEGDKSSFDTLLAEAKRGDAFAQNKIGNLARGYDNAAAIAWYRKSADQGYANAQYNMGLCYYNGFGTAINYTEAASWYQKSVAQGYDKAQYNLGTMYKSGKGVPQDLAKALSLYRKAAEQGNMHAQSALGFHYLTGQGIEVNSALGESWIKKAAAQGEERALKYLAKNR
ncbi:tetratricopeptide repeat protein [Chitinibacter sp. FCG-7]|uniref:Tetratricopeptide repeat protein n=1 Tax=Chitinibacter mangrovi TaxID=3153927 RepID=A0AAU7F887_9NEIS